MPSLLRARLAMAAVLIALFAFALPGIAQANGFNPKAKINVETRNLYLGADLQESINALLALNPSNPATIANLLSANACTYQRVVKTDFPTRAKALAKEVDVADPLLIGLQEVAIWRTGALNSPTPATTVEYEFLDTLLAELAARGLNYAPVVIQQEFEFESPAGVCQSTGYVVGKDVRLTMRDVILARTDIPKFLFKTSNPQSANYSNAVSVQFPNPLDPSNPIVVKRGWTSIDVSVLGIPAIRFFNTHLEAFSAAARTGQAAELLATPAMNTKKLVILAGDLNSDPAESSPDSDAYNLITGPGRFRETGNTDDTCCHAELLTNPTENFTQRIDHILTRPGLGGLVDAHVIGDDANKRVFSSAAGGLIWPSDHGGVIAGLDF
jgi:hypothetical protein